MIISYTFLPPSPPNFHVHMVFNNLKKLARLWNSPSLKFGPNGHVIQVDLECPRADKLRLHRIAEEEGHHAGVDLVLQHPGGPGRSILPQEWERVE